MVNVFDPPPGSTPMLNPMDYEGKCRGCGLLAKTSMGVSSGLPPVAYEVTMEERILPSLENSWQPNVGMRKSQSFCFAGVRFKTYLEQLADNSHPAFEREINEDKHCERWVEYHPNLDPRWHWENDQMQRLEEQRRRWEADMERERQALDERLNSDNKAFLKGLEDERRAWEKKEGRWGIRFVIAALALAAAEVVGNVPAVQRFLGLD